ncbi:MAG: hypothetical protein RR573_01750 [Oscillospiraceae bacterium]
MLNALNVLSYALHVVKRRGASCLLIRYNLSAAAPRLQQSRKGLLCFMLNVLCYALHGAKRYSDSYLLGCYTYP